MIEQLQEKIDYWEKHRRHGEAMIATANRNIAQLKEQIIQEMSDVDGVVADVSGQDVVVWSRKVEL